MVHVFFSSLFYFAIVVETCNRKHNAEIAQR